MNKKSIYTGIAIAAGAALIIAAAIIVYKRTRFSCKNSYLFIGDSNTAGSTSYADKFIKKCKNPKNKKIAKVGAKTSWMLPQLEEELKKNKYDVVTILAGSNDIFATLSIKEAKQNMDRMLRIIKDSGAKAVVITPPFKGYYTRTTDKHWALIKEWNKYLKSHKIPVAFIDFSNIVKDKSLFASDNQHVNSTGHQVLADAFSDKLKIA
jgi:lysophospholipase L1-like esterase